MTDQSRCIGRTRTHGACNARHLAPAASCARPAGPSSSYKCGIDYHMHGCMHHPFLFSPDRQEQEACRCSTEHPQPQLGRPVARPSLSRRPRRYGSKGSRTSIGGSVVCVVAPACPAGSDSDPTHGMDRSMHPEFRIGCVQQGARWSTATAKWSTSSSSSSSLFISALLTPPTRAKKALLWWLRERCRPV